MERKRQRSPSSGPFGDSKDNEGEEKTEKRARWALPAKWYCPISFGETGDAAGRQCVQLRPDAASPLSPDEMLHLTVYDDKDECTRSCQRTQRHVPSSLVSSASTFLSPTEMAKLARASRATRASAAVPLELLQTLYEKMATSVVPVRYDSSSAPVYSKRLLREGIDAFRHALQYAPRLAIDRELVVRWFGQLPDVDELAAETDELVELMVDFFGNTLPLVELFTRKPRRFQNLMRAHGAPPDDIMRVWRILQNGRDEMSVKQREATLRLYLRSMPTGLSRQDTLAYLMRPGISLSRAQVVAVSPMIARVLDLSNNVSVKDIRDFLIEHDLDLGPLLQGGLAATPGSKAKLVQAVKLTPLADELLEQIEAHSR